MTQCACRCQGHGGQEPSSATTGRETGREPFDDPLVPSSDSCEIVINWEINVISVK